MKIEAQDRVRMERAHVQAWPALRTENIDGWLWRSSGGGSQRANSVSTVDFHGSDIETSIDTVQARYAAVGAPARFQTFDETAPATLTQALRRRGYTEGDATQTMFAPVASTAAPPEVEIRDYPWDEWCDVYMGAITETRRMVNREILKKIPQPSAFFGCRVNGQIVSTALGVAGHGCAVVECVATRPDARRQGAAATVMTGLLSWAAQQDADLLGLQVVAGNVGAIRLYGRLGFIPGATNRFWLAGNQR